MQGEQVDPSDVTNVTYATNEASKAGEANRTVGAGVTLG
jgi:hypothetical protein